MNSDILSLGKIQIDELFQWYHKVTMDDSDFIPILDVIIEAFKYAGSPAAVIGELRSHAMKRYHDACQEAAPEIPFQDNKKLMLSYLLPARGKVWDEHNPDLAADVSIEDVAQDVKKAE